MTNVPSDLWVRRASNNPAVVNPSTQVSTEKCSNVDKFIDAVKNKLQLSQPPDQINLHLTENSASLRRSLPLTELSSQNGYVQNAEETPLYVKVTPAQPGSSLASPLTPIGKHISLLDAEALLSQFWTAKFDNAQEIAIDDVRAISFNYTIDDISQMNQLLKKWGVSNKGCSWCMLGKTDSNDEETLKIILDQESVQMLSKVDKKPYFAELVKFGTFHMGFPAGIFPMSLQRGIVNEFYSTEATTKKYLCKSDDDLVSANRFLRRFHRLLHKYNLFHYGLWKKIEKIDETSVFYSILQEYSIVKEMTWNLSLDEWANTLKLAKLHLCHDMVTPLLGNATEKDQVLRFIRGIQRGEEEQEQENFIFDFWFFLYLVVMIVRGHFFIQQPNISQDVGKIGTRKEAIAGTGIFSPMFQFCTFFLSGANSRAIPELNMSSLVSIFYKDVFADMTSVLVGKNDQITPFLIIEYATESPGHEESGDRHEMTMEHKDMGKISVSMAAAMLHLLDLLGDEAWSDDVYPYVSVFGALVYNWTVQFIELRPILLTKQKFESAIEMVLNSPPEWCVSLHDGNPLRLSDMNKVFEGVVKVWHIMKGIHDCWGNISPIVDKERDRAEQAVKAKVQSKIRYVFPPGAEPYAPKSLSKIKSQTPEKRRRGNGDSVESIGEESNKDDVYETVESLLLKEEFDITAKHLHYRGFHWELQRKGKDYYGMLKWGRSAVEEYQFLTKVDSPFIVKVLFAASGPNDAWQLMVEPLLYNDYELLLYEDYVPNLFDRVKHLVQFMDNVLRGLAALHSKFILHCDIKRENILYDRLKRCWVIIDFNCAFALSSATEQLDNKEFNAPGTKGLQAPEIVQGGFYGLAADIYSFGRTLYLILISDEVVDLPLNKKYHPSNVVNAMESMHKLVFSMLSVDPSDRPSALTALTEVENINGLLHSEPNEPLAKSRRISRTTS